MKRLLPVLSDDDIPSEYRNTPIGQLLTFHNLKVPFAEFHNARILVGMCMDNRKHLHIPDNFAFIIRAGGANLRYSEFKVSFAIAVGGVRHMALIGHNNCSMVNLHSRKDEFIEGLVEHAGWERELAEQHFTQFAPMFEIMNEIDFVLNETKRLRVRYPKIHIAPLLYRIEDNLLYLISEQ